MLPAVALSLFVSACPQVLQAGFPQKTPEAFKATVALVAVGVLLGMMTWTRISARSIRGALQGSVDAALARPQGAGRGSWWAGLQAFAHEGLESVFFLLTVFHSRASAPGRPRARFLGMALSIALRDRGLSRRRPTGPYRRRSSTAARASW